MIYFLFKPLLKLVAFSFLKKSSRTSMSKEADVFRRLSVLIETPVLHILQN